MTSVVHEPSAVPQRPDVIPQALSLAERYLGVRNLTERLAEPLSPEDQTVQSMPDVSPTKWHRAHTSWFFETFLLDNYAPGYRQFHPEFGYLFNSYYESVGPRHPRPERGFISRPDCASVTAYRRHVDEHMMALLERPLDERASFLCELGLHHEQQHQELLLMDIKHVLSQSPIDPAYGPRPARSPSRRRHDAGEDAEWIEHDGGLVAIGHTGSAFSFDNETPAHRVNLQPFAIAGRLVTCGQWLEFMRDGGYQRPDLWLSDGWAAVQEQRWSAPLYWKREGSGPCDWSIFTLSGRRPLNPGEPVCHVSYFEADAFATWAGVRLPTEFEWESVAAHQPVCGRFLDANSLHQLAPHPEPQPATTLYGDAWVWTSSAYLPYPGFRTAPGAVGEYNGKFMVNQHVLRGGSCVTPEGHVRATYRNFFPPSARWPFTGVRLARDL